MIIEIEIGDELCEKDELHKILTKCCNSILKSIRYSLESNYDTLDKLDKQEIICLLLIAEQISEKHQNI